MSLSTCQLFWFGVEKKKSIAKNTLQHFLLLSTMFYNQDVVENVVAKLGFSTNV
jgi:hypothetical protein